MAMLISQKFFDETLLETQELFEYDDEQAVKETIVELSSSRNGDETSQPPSAGAVVSLEHLTLTHPDSTEGKEDRNLQRMFVKSLLSMSQRQADVVMATQLLKEALARHDENIKDNSIAKPCSHPLLMIWSLMLQQSLWREALENTEEDDDYFNQMNDLTSFVVTLFPDDSSLSLTHPMSRSLKLEIAPSWFFVLKNDEQDNDDGSDVIMRTLGDCHWFKLLDLTLQQQEKGNYDRLLVLKVIQVARKLCNGCENNKKAFVQAAVAYESKTSGRNGLELLVQCLGDASAVSDSDNHGIVREACRLIAVLGKFQPLTEPSARANDSQDLPEGQQAPLVSSAHANVKELHKAGAVPSLHRIAKRHLAQKANQEDGMDVTYHELNNDTGLLCDSLAALRVMAIDNDIVQNMIALGILGTVRDSLKVTVEQSSTASPESCLPLATATFGLVRNLCANDEVKTTICKSSLLSILCVMQSYLILEQSSAKQEHQIGAKSRKGCAALQEHACGILGAMALRQPNNAEAIIGNDVSMTDSEDCINDNQSVNPCGHVLILQTMKAFPDRPALQRQGCLALRNIASRLSASDKDRILEAGAEEIIQNIAGRHPASSEEAYAALRDLGCNPVIYDLDESGTTRKSTTEVFGSVTSNFRPVYE